MLTLFLELLTFFTNTVLLACILGISVGCLAADSKRNFLPYTPLMLIIGFASAHLVEWQRHMANSIIDVAIMAAIALLLLAPYYAGLFLSLIVSALVPMEYFLGMDRLATGETSVRLKVDTTWECGVRLQPDPRIRSS